MIILLDLAVSLNRRGRRLDNGYMDFGKTELILDKKFGQNRTNGLRFPTIFPLIVLVFELADAVFHDFAPETELIVQNTVRLSTPIGSQ